MPYAEPTSPVSPINSSGFSSLLHSPRSESISFPGAAQQQGSNLLSKVEAQKALQRALMEVEGQRAETQDEDQVEMIKDEEPREKEDGHTSRPGWSRRHHYSGSITPSHSGPSTPTVLPRRNTSSRNGSRQTSPLATPMSFEVTSPLATAWTSTSNSLPRRTSSNHVSPSHGQTMSGIDRRGGKKSDTLGLRGITRPVRDSQSSVSTLDTDGPTTPMDEITLSLQRYAAEQEAAEKRKRHTRGRTTSQDLDVSVDMDDSHSTTRVDGLPRRRSYDRTPSRDRTPDAMGLPPKEKESVIPFPKSGAAAEQEPAALVPTPASPLKSNTAIHRVINPRHATRSGPSLGLRRQPSSSLQLDIPATPPINYHDLDSGSSTPYASTWEGNRPTSSMIRKKSGELVKPSLKVRSQSTPHLPLRGDMMGSKSEPATPAPAEDDRDFGSDRHKNVRFAGSSGDQGARLESVVLFLREQKVTAVSKTADGEEGMYPPTETETEADTDAREYAAFRRKRNAALQSQDEGEKFAFGDSSSVVPKVRLDFSPMSNSGGLKDHNVILERAEMSSASEPVALRGTILVRNVAFQKWVAVRFTMDDWQ
jgi:hypothetical protein